MSFQGRQQRNRKSESRCEWVAKGPTGSLNAGSSQDASSGSVSADSVHGAGTSSGASRRDGNSSSGSLRRGAYQRSVGSRQEADQSLDAIRLGAYQSLDATRRGAYQSLDATRRDANFGFAKSDRAASRRYGNSSSAAPKDDANQTLATPRHDANSSSVAASSKKFSVPDARRRGNNFASKGQTDSQRKGRERFNNHGERGANDPNLPQLAQEIQEKLMKGKVECMICYDMVRRSAPMWSCKSCFSIFHLNCIKKWARNPASVDLMAEKSQGSNWRCPGCQAVQLTQAKEIRYMCFCGKRLDPPSDLYLTPHSCGEPCGKPLEKEIPSPDLSKEDLCPHMCVLQCHPGPCPPCKAFAPPCLCPCGKKTITTRCIDRKSVLTCGQRCDKLLDCQRHRCERVCHVGPCDSCQVLVNASCFCRKKVEVVLCGEMGVKGEVRAEDGVFSCNSTCEKKLNCNNHSCHEVCHPGPCGDCELMPGRIKTCYCGKTSLKKERQNCLDPIPTCSQTCEKLLPCGLHRCEEACHAGTCPPCSVHVTQKCRCGSSTRNVECHKTTGGETFICDRQCDRKRSCGRHRCSERCCPLSKRNTRLNGEWDPHLCSIPCGKKLRCGQHMCNSLCHSGHCPPCLETIFTELTCACGRTSIPPPQPCGTPPPSCQFPCSVPQPCGHSAVHNCHFGDCPPCSVPVAKECIGGHVIIRNIPCGSKDIRCNKLCGKTRQCGLHACARTCHQPPCDVSHEVGQGQRASCGQTCGAPRRDCRHSCAAPCHPSTSCPDVKCEFPVTITCSCGRISATVACDAGGKNDGYSGDAVYEASIIQKLPVPLQPIEGVDKRIPLGQRKLMCDDECAKLERKRVLADAFDIQTPNLDVLHTGEDPVMSELLADIYRRDPKWVIAVEERFKYLVLSKSKGNLSGVKVHVFCPVLKEKRDALRFMAERWKLAINYAGWEPKRFIAVHVTPKSRVPPRVIGVKGLSVMSVSHPPVFDPLVDMDPRLVVSFPDLPRDADISALVLRFGGECELVWLNDKNAIAVFSDPARAATAMRRVDHGSIYHGAVVVPQNWGSAVTSTGNSAWGGAGLAGGGKFATSTVSSWKKAVTQEPSLSDDSWGDEHFGTSSDRESSVWRGKDAPIAASVNRWSVLNPEINPSLQSMKIDSKGKQIGDSSSGLKSDVGKLNEEGQDVTYPNEDAAEILDDWEKACE